MKKELILQLKKSFEESAYQEDDIEYWLARDLQKLLGYTKWENFVKVIEKAKEACNNSKQSVSDHFPEVRKKVHLGSESIREIKDYMLTRYACYLIAQNGDPRKEIIAFAQSYFAIQTRKQEILEQRIALTERLLAREKLIATETELSKTIYERGVDSLGFARIRSGGDYALFGGNSTFQMKKKLGIPNKRPLADFLPTITIKAKDLAAEISNFNIKKKNFSGESKIKTDQVVINGHKFSNLTKKLEEVYKRLEERLLDTKYTFIHGDLTMSNTVISSKNKLYLIDPRGGFGNTKIYGDPRYDVAKLYYSIFGNYDSLNNGRFSYKKDPKDFKIQRTISVFREMIRRGKELESNLGLIGGHFGWLGAPEVISPKGLRRFITHTWGIRFIYGVILAMWIVILIAFFIN